MQQRLLTQILSSAGLALVITSGHAANNNSDNYLLLADMDIDEVMQLKESGAIMPLEEVLRRVKEVQPGRVIEVELDDDDERYTYELEVVDERGIVWDIDIDARSGELLERERDD